MDTKGKFRRKDRQILVVWQELRKGKTAIIGLAITVCVLFLAIFGPVLTPYSPTTLDFDNILKSPSLNHPFGTDSLGRDVLTRIIYGIRISVGISFMGIAVASLIGVIVGLISGYFGGIVDDIVMRFVDLLFAFPSYVLALFLMVVLGFGIINVILAMALVYIPIFARLMRGMTQMIKEEQYVDAARTVGMNDIRIMFMEILPNGISPIIVQATLAVAYAIILEAGLSFLGLGVQPPAPSLGIILADGKEFLRLGWWIVTFTGLLITLMLLGFNLLGDGLRDALDPKLAGQIRRV
jgi:peptide/nickel transport system permease protein